MFIEAFLSTLTAYPGYLTIMGWRTSYDEALRVSLLSQAGCAMTGQLGWARGGSMLSMSLSISLFGIITQQSACEKGLHKVL